MDTRIFIPARYHRRFGTNNCASTLNTKPGLWHRMEESDHGITYLASANKSVEINEAAELSSGHCVYNN